MNDINIMLGKLSKSNFRSSFHLKDKDFKYIEEKGLTTIEKHANDFIRRRLAPQRDTK